MKALGESGDFTTFKVHARRSSTVYPKHSIEINQLVGAVLCENFPDKSADA